MARQPARAVRSGGARYSGREMASGRRLQVAEGGVEGTDRGRGRRRWMTFCSSRMLPGPGIANQGIHDGGRDRLDPPAHPPGEPLGKMADQCWVVVAALRRGPAA